MQPPNWIQVGLTCALIGYSQCDSSLAKSEFEDAASELDPGGFDLCAD